MGSEDVKRQSPNVYRMKLLGATVVPVTSGSRTLKDALNEAMRDWVANVDNTFYIIGTVAGPHPSPMMVRDFQSVIGEECLTQMPEMFKSLQMAEQQPDAVLACDEFAEIELPRHAGLLCEVVRPGHALGRAVRAPDRDGLARPLRVVALRDVEPAQVEAVIGMQVGEDDGVDVRQSHMALQHTQGPIAEVEHESEPVVLDEVAGRGRIGPGERSGAADHSEAHGLRLRGQGRPSGQRGPP
jgi:hypothetical protein